MPQLERNLYIVGPVYHRPPDSIRPVIPSRDLVMEIINLPYGSKVGIAAFFGIEDISEVKEEMSEEDIKNQGFYWRRITGLCERFGHEVVYLYDQDTYLEQVDKYRKFHHIVESKNPGENDYTKIKNFERKIYKARVEHEYADAIHQETVFKKISQTRPDLLILQGSVADLLIHATGLPEYLGVPLSSCKIEDHMGLVRPNFIRAEIGYDMLYPNGKMLPTWDLAKRSYRALKEGRVMAEGTPDFIGTWDPDIPERGLFELYVGDNVIEQRFGELFLPVIRPVIERSCGEGCTLGLIEDCLGTAIFGGTVGEVTHFYKMYILNLSSDFVIPCLEYNGEMDCRGTINGTFTARGNEIGDFTLSKFQGKHNSNFSPQICLN